MYVEKEAAKLAFSRLEIGQYLAFAYLNGQLTAAAKPCSSEPAARKSALALCRSLGPYYAGYVVERRAEQEPDELNEYYPFWVFAAADWVPRKKDYVDLGRFVSGWPFHVKDLFTVKIDNRPPLRTSALAAS